MCGLWPGILSERPHRDRRTITVLSQSLWLKSLTARQRCLAGNANSFPVLRNKSPHVPTLKLEDQETVFVRLLTGDQPERPHRDRRTITVLSQSLWLKSLTARQRCLAGNANSFPVLRNKSPHVPTLKLEDQETVFVRLLTGDQPGMRDYLGVAGTPLLKRCHDYCVVSCSAVI
ncbi:hypothetical protein CSKR_103592 [Clonorchis sinensis]|uniref:Uncharacterized protein n=1 Tax=Clonorchis sinensis TaxID=79923 RepID=A0A3R7CZG2_CLOSI|nr:hypothetical protein CSKR_103592 [Clonorchis sinensis]